VQETTTAVAILQAVARGWCHPKNSGKVMDSDLAIAISAEVNALLSEQPVQAEPVAWLVDLDDSQYAVTDIDDAQAIDDCTNHGAQMTPLYDSRQAAPVSAEDARDAEDAAFNRWNYSADGADFCKLTEGTRVEVAFRDGYRAALAAKGATHG
jgi:hypothetical protein